MSNFYTSDLPATSRSVRNGRGTRYATHRELELRRACGLDRGSLEVYQELQKAHSRFRFSKFVTARFSSSLTDLIEVQAFNRQIKHKINKFFYGRRPSPLKFSFIIEPDKISHQGMTAYHIHYLISSTVDCQRKLTRLPTLPSELIEAQLSEPMKYFYVPQGAEAQFISRGVKSKTKQSLIFKSHQAVRLSYARDKQLRKTNRLAAVKTYFYQPTQVSLQDNQMLITDPLNVLLFKKTRRTKVHTAEGEFSISSVQVDDVYHQECLVDYLLKRVKRKPEDLILDCLNSSDFNFT